MNAALLEATDPRGFLLKHLNAGVRPDGRADPPFSSRKISATSSEGKSTVRIGEVVGVADNPFATLFFRRDGELAWENNQYYRSLIKN